MTRLRIVAAVVGAAWVSPLAAQRTPEPSRRPIFAVARGEVTDSLHGGALANAFVIVEGATRGAGTDSAGRFFVDSLAPGTYRLALVHPLLDTVGLRIVTAPLTFAPGDTVRVELAIPSAQTIVRAKCGTQRLPGGAAAVLGIVINGETEEPVEGATIVLAWSEIQATRETGVRHQPRQRSTKSLADGTFRICGLPAQLSADIVAWSGPDTTAVTPIALDTALLALRALALPSGGAEVVQIDTGAQLRPPRGAPRGAPRVAPAVLRRGHATVRGTVTTAGGRPIIGARVSVVGAVGMTLTDDRGQFALSGQPAGTQIVVVRRLGYAVVEVPINLSTRSPRELAVKLNDFVPVLETVRVQAKRDAGLVRVGFANRKKSGMGTYLSPEDLERRSALRVVDLLTQIPMLRVVSTGGSGRKVVGRSRGVREGCVQFYVDGFPWVGEGSPDDYMNPAEVGAIEAYSATSTPAEFQRSFSSCETVAIWTKHKLGM